MNNLSNQNQKDTKLNQSTSNFKPNYNTTQEVILPISSSAKTQAKMIRILIAEDQYTYQQIWQSYLEPEPDLEIIGTAIDGQAAIELVKKLKPDVVLMDINMPRMDGLTATEIITHHYVQTKILILSISDDVKYIKKSLQIGAKGYFLKSIAPQELVTAIRNIHRGYCQLGQGLIEKLDSDTSPIPLKQFDHTNNSSDLINQSKSKVLLSPTAEPALTSSNSNLRLPILLLSGVLVFLFTPPGRNWWSKLPILLTFQPDRAITAQDSDSTAILPVETIKVNLVDSYQVDRTYTGTIIPRRSSSLGFEHSGKLLKLTVDVGEQVKVGTPLAFLDTKKLKAKQQEILAERKQVHAILKELQAGSRSETIAAAQSTVKSLQSQLKLARTKDQRRQELYTSGAISREQLDEATTEVNTFQARLSESQSKLNELLTGTRPEKIQAQKALLEQLDAKLASLAIELEQSTLKAPFTGRIANRFVDEGTVVSTGQPIFTIVEAQALEAHIGVPVNTAVKFPLGSKQQLQIGARKYQAQVLSILPQLNSASRTLTIVLSLEQSVAREVRPGQIARLKLSETIANSGYWLPTTALVRGVRGLWSCYVLENSEIVTSNSQKAFRVEQREVEVLQTEGDRVLVRGTIKDGDRVIVNGNHRLVTGQLVRPLEIVNFSRPAYE